MPLTDLRIEDLRLFLNIVDAGSITAAADHMQLPKSNLSRRLKLIEENLGVRLLDRTTRSLQQTEAGAKFYADCERILSSLEAAHQRIMDNQDAITGRLTVYAPNELLRYGVQELAVAFSEAYPALGVEFLSGAVKPHLLHDSIDVMVHIDDPQDSSFVARKVTFGNTNYYASPGYIARHGQPKTPQDLQRHDCIVELTHERVARPWTFARGGSVMTVHVKGRYACDTIDLCRLLCEKGLGIAMLPEFICHERIADHRLQPLFAGRYATRHNIYAVYASRHFVPARIRAFVDFLAKELPRQL
jgi:DNA-binding transcriptional LysR family regulator